MPTPFAGPRRAALARVWRAGRAGMRRLLAPPTAGRLAAAAATGLLAGLLAGLALPLLAGLAALVSGAGLWAPPRAIARMFLGRQYPGGGLGLAAVAVGTGLHLALSAGFGVAYALVAGLARRRLSTPAQVAGGLLFGLGRWATNTFVLAPRLPGGELMTAAMPPWAWLAGHLLYGALLGLLYARWRGDRMAPAG
jgi:hypothetical protein